MSEVEIGFLAVETMLLAGSRPHFSFAFVFWSQLRLCIY